MDVLQPGAVEAHVLLGPAAAELLAAGGEFADEVGESLVVRVAPGVAAQGGDDLVGVPFPVGVERRGVGVEEEEAGVVRRPHRVLEERRVEGAAELVGGDEVHPFVADPGRRAGDGVEEALQAGPDLLVGPGGCATALAWAGPGLTGEVEEMCALGFVEPQYAGD